jgi:hypothetical protein
MSCHLENYTCPREPKSLSQLCDEEYCVSCVGHVRRDEWYECVILNDSINVVMIGVCNV